MAPVFATRGAGSQLHTGCKSLVSDLFAFRLELDLFREFINIFCREFHTLSSQMSASNFFTTCLMSNKRILIVHNWEEITF